MQFASDLRFALGSWRAAPTIPLAVAVFSLVELAGGRVPVVALLVAIAPLGVLGAEWLFYLRCAQGRPFGLNEVPDVATRLFGRYVRMGCLVMLGPTMVLFAVAFGLAASRSKHPGDAAVPHWFIVALLAESFAFDVLLTFVMPALVYVTDSVLDALRLGVGYALDTWRTTWWYLLGPGLTLTWIAVALAPSGGRLALGAVGAVVGGLAGFALKGAIARAFLRGFPPISGDGTL